ncbi:hypothetical protein MXK52_03545 [Listeria innocua]|nr:hypothetical protein [Listeria innocua]MBC6116313.1 hypothetical protein [Listeria innocua]UPH51936.1 hypothetical protein EWI69_03555 [Listeria innocua]UPH61827.1 hypothetical protein AB346_08905 [Listeria innocua]UVD66628.1 hypothetical protein MXK52_03545 [Listeria innocua]
MVKKYLALSGIVTLFPNDNTTSSASQTIEVRTTGINGTSGGTLYQLN